MSEGATSRGSVRDVNMNSTELSLLSKSANLAGKILGTSSVKLLGLPDNRMDSLDRLDIIKLVEKEVDRLKPHTVVTHHGGDLNIDHRIIYESVITACRPQPGHVVKRLLTFEVVSSTEWQPSGSNSVFRPNWFEDVSITIDRKIEALKEYKKNHGDCLVPHNWPENKKLGIWVYKTRQHYKNGKVSDERFKRLDDIGFVWDPLEFVWKRKFEALKEYKRNHGDCNVPQNSADNSQLSNWVQVQRTNYKKGKLPENRIKCLESIGFEWNIRK